MGEGDFTGLVDQVRGGEYRNRLKVISFKDLIRLFRLRRALDRRLPAPQVCQVVQDLLLPFDSINVAGILDIIEGIAGTALGIAYEGPGAGASDRGDWRRSDVGALLDELPAPQLLLLLALATAPEGRLHREELVRTMNRLAPTMPSLEGSTFTSRTLAGARAAISKREELLGKDGLITTEGSGYALCPRCLDWVTDWFDERGMLPAAHDPGPALGGLFGQAQGMGSAAAT